jgi:hypothetical protein
MDPKFFRQYSDLISEAEAAPIVDDEWFKNGAFQTSKKPIPVPYTIADIDGVTKTLEGPVPHKAGHYIMGPGPKGEFWPLDPENFHSKYDDNGDGTGTPKGGVTKLAKLADHDGVIHATWGDLNYKAGEDVIVRHGPGDYGPVKKDIFADTYQTQ